MNKEVKKQMQQKLNSQTNVWRLHVDFYCADLERKKESLQNINRNHENWFCHTSIYVLARCLEELTSDDNRRESSSVC